MAGFFVTGSGYKKSSNWVTENMSSHHCYLVSAVVSEQPKLMYPPVFNNCVCHLKRKYALEDISRGAQVILWKYEMCTGCVWQGNTNGLTMSQPKGRDPFNPLKATTGTGL